MSVHLSANRYWSHHLHDVQDLNSLTDSFYWGYDLTIRVRRARLTLCGDLVRMCHSVSKGCRETFSSVTFTISLLANSSFDQFFVWLIFCCVFFLRIWWIMLCFSCHRPNVSRQFQATGQTWPIFWVGLILQSWSHRLHGFDCHDSKACLRINKKILDIVGGAHVGRDNRHRWPWNRVQVGGCWDGGG